MAKPKSATEPAPYVKTPPQLQQWAAYEAITAQRAHEKKIKVELGRNADALFDSANQWGRATHIRSFVDATMGKVPNDADTVTLGNATQWKDWALGVAASLDHAQLQADEFKVSSHPVTPTKNPAG